MAAKSRHEFLMSYVMPDFTREDRGFFARAQLALREMAPERRTEVMSEVMRRAREHGGFLGRGGYCYQGAIAIREMLFRGEGSFVCGYNGPVWKACRRRVGHVAVLYRGACWDFEGAPKTPQDIQAWGDLTSVAEGYRAEVEEAHAPLGSLPWGASLPR